MCKAIIYHFFYEFSHYLMSGIASNSPTDLWRESQCYSFQIFTFSSRLMPTKKQDSNHFNDLLLPSINTFSSLPFRKMMGKKLQNVS